MVYHVRKSFIIGYSLLCEMDRNRIDRGLNPLAGHRSIANGGATDREKIQQNYQLKNVEILIENFSSKLSQF